MGHAADAAFTRYHQVLNRTVWSPRAASQVPLLLLLTAFLPPPVPIEIVIDAHRERHWGPRILQRGHYRDPLLSGKGLSVRTSGLRWICVLLLVPLPWTTCRWALPFLTIITTLPAVATAPGLRPKTLTIWAHQGVIRVRRWWPTALNAAPIPAWPVDAAPSSASVPPPAAVTPPTIRGANAAPDRELLVRYPGRWRLAGTLEESRAHLGVATQRQWSKLALARSTPGRMGLFSVVVLCGQALHPDGRIAVGQAAWYPKSQATFSDVPATVRRHVWHQELLDSRAHGGEQITIRGADLARVMQAAAA